MSSHLIFFHSLSPLHCGTGQGVGTIDLPIAREKSTNIPLIPGSSLKGALRALSSSNLEEQVAVFGPTTADADAFGGAVHFSDLTLLCLPVRSVSGTFAWVTSPYLLKRIARDSRDLGFENRKLPADPSSDGCAVCSESSLCVEPGLVILDDLDLKARVNDRELDAWASWIASSIFTSDQIADGWAVLFKKRLLLIDDDLFSYLLETATEVVARVALDSDTKTVKPGALWYEESLPVESLMFGLIQINAPKNGSKVSPKDVIRRLCEQPVQLGGKATVGRGLGHLRLVGGK